MEYLLNLIVIIIGFAGGLAVGSAFVAFITVLDIIPRLTQMVKGFAYIKWFERALITGTVIFTLIDFWELIFNMPALLTLVIGLFAGIFIGVLAGALTEVLNVLPILAKRLSMTNAIIILLMAMVFGKVSGSLFHWIFFVQNK